MKLKIIFFLLLLYLPASFPQAFDSLITNPMILGDSTKTDTLTFGNDSTKIILTETSSDDSLALFDSSKTKAAVDTLIPIYQHPLSPGSSFISHNEIIRSDYEYTGDIVKKFPFASINETGLYGHPDDVYIYGVIPGAISYLKNNIQVNNSYGNGFDLNLIQSETIDSIEVLNLPRGFLYSIDNNPVTINFIEKDFLSISPNSRIKYYEGPYGKALFDGIFNTILFNKFNLFLDITNRKGDDSYNNSAYGIWQGTAKLKYHYSNSLNLIASYGYVKSEVGLNGGINVDSISKHSTDIEGDLYDVQAAPVYFLTGRQEVLGHNYTLNALWKYDQNWNTDIKLYYFFNQKETINLYSDSSNYKNKYTRYGININQVYSSSLFRLNLIGSYENSDIDNFIIFNPRSSEEESITQKSGSFAAIASFSVFDSLVNPSVFYKYSAHKIYLTSDESGIGFDVNVSIPENFKAYFGYSVLTNFNTASFETGIKFSNENLYADLRYFIMDGYNIPAFYDGLIKGAGLKINYYLWNVLLEGNAFYLFDFKPGLDGQFRYEPSKYKLDAGIYYKDILFNSNLDLKAGFRFYLNDKVADTYLNHDSQFYSASNYKLDFTMSAVIRKAAIVYFTWENLTNNRYFVVPYYPMPERNIRFGIAWDLFN